MENNTTIIDNGTGLLKAGFSGEEQPSVIIHNIIGEKKCYDGQENNEEI